MRKVILLATGLLLAMSVTVFAEPEPRHDKIPIVIESNYGGQLSPKGHIEVFKGENVIVNIRSERGFIIKRVLVDGRNIGSVPEYEFKYVEYSHEMFVEFEKVRHETPHPHS